MNLPVVSVAEMRAAEEAAFASGATAEALMDAAAAGIARTVGHFFPEPGRCVVFAGKGNNAGDGFATTAILQSLGWQVDLRLAFAEDELGELPRKKLHALKRVAGRAEGRTVILDGLLGLGTKPPLRDPIRTACREINQLRQTTNAFVVALDLPSGLDGDSGDADEDCVVADLTVTIGFAKRGLLADRALNHVGRLEVAPLPELRAPDEQFDASVATAASLGGLLPPRAFDAFKNQFGRVGVVAGSRGFVGAALMSSLGALRGGAGLVELFVPEDIYSVVACAAAPEAMVKPITSYRELLDEKVDVWAVGPGLGTLAVEDILALIEGASQPMVLDADGLNMAARDVEVLNRARGPRLVTPHPGEMKRLFPLEDVSRAEQARRFCERFKVALLYKGSRTIVAAPAQPLSYNTTGNPGMATGGMGDVLTGVCAALIAQKLSPYDAARLGAWVCGCAAEIAIFRGDASEQSLLPLDVIEYLGMAFRRLHSM